MDLAVVAVADVAAGVDGIDGDASSAGVRGVVADRATAATSLPPSPVYAPSPYIAFCDSSTSVLQTIVSTSLCPDMP